MAAESLKSFLSGGFGGSLVVLFGHPLDTIKVRLMTDTRNQYLGTIDCIKSSIRQSGIRGGLFPGMAIPMLTVAPIYATYFWAFDEGKQWACKLYGGCDEDDLPLGGIVLAGAVSALFGTAIIIPGDLIKVQLQVEANKPPMERRFHGPITCINHVIKQHGPLGLFRGSGITMLREIPSTIVYYSVYEVMKHPIHDWYVDGTKGSVDDSHHPIAIVLAGGLAGSAYTLASIPADVLKSRYQTSPPGRFPGGVMQVAKELMQIDGPLGFFKGTTPALLRNFPSNGACFLGVEYSKRFLDTYL